MLYNKSPEREQINFFRMFVSSCKEGDNKYKDVVDNVLIEARALARDKERIYSIPRHYFTVIHFLSDVEREFLLTHKSDIFTEKDYTRILDALMHKQESYYW